MAAIIQIDQVRPLGTSFGSPGVARNDCWVARTINLTSTQLGSTYQWTLTPPLGSGATLSGANSQVANFLPDVAGTYRIRLDVNGGGGANTQYLVVRVRFDTNGVSTKFGLAIPAFLEAATGAGESNYSGNVRGWDEPWYRTFQVLTDLYEGARVVDNFAAVRTLTTGEHLSVATRGKTTAGDDLGGFFDKVVGSPPAEDDSNITPTGSTTFWYKRRRLPVTTSLAPGPANTVLRTNQAGVVEWRTSYQWESTVPNPTVKQDDVATNGVSGQTLTVQAQNATGTTSIGGYLDLSSGTGTTSNGSTRIFVGAKSLLSYETGGTGTGHFSQLKAGTAGGFYFDADIFRVRSSAGAERGNWRLAGLRIGDATAATDMLDVVGRAKVGVNTAKVILDSHPSFPTTDASIWLGQAAPSGTNYTIDGSANDTIFNAVTKIHLAISNAVHASLTTTGFRVGDGTTATEKLDIIGRAKIGVGTAKVIADGLPGSENLYSGLWFNIVPSGTNFSFLGNGVHSFFNAPSGAGQLYMRLGNTSIGTFASTGLRIGDETIATAKLDVVGDAKIGVNTAKVFADSFGAFGATHAAIWLGAITPDLTNEALAGDGTSNVVNAITRVQVAAGSTVHSVFTASGLSLGTTSDPTERLDVVGRAKFGVDAGKVQIDSLIGAAASWGAIWMGTATPTGSNEVLSSNGSQTLLKASTEVTGVIGASIGFVLRSTGFGIGTASGLNPAERLHVAGNICFDTATSTPKVYQRDVTTGSATGQALTVQAQNATGATSTGGALVLQSGTGTTENGVVTVKSGSTTVATFGEPQSTFTNRGLVVGTGTAKIWLRSYPGFENTDATIWLGPITPSGTNYTLSASSTIGTLNAASKINLTIAGASAAANFTSTGVRIGDSTSATEKFEVTGNIRISTTSSQKIFQQDFTTNEAGAGPNLTVQAANSTGTNTNGGHLNLTSGTAVSGSSGTVNVQHGGSTKLNTTTTGVAVTGDAVVSGNAVVTGYVSTGSTTASSGSVRLPNAGAVAARNQANSANVSLITLDSSNNIQVGESTILTVNNGGTSIHVRSTSSSITVDQLVSAGDTRDEVISVDSTAATRTITLPTPTVGRRITVKHYAGANTVNVEPGTNNIDGDSSTWVLAAGATGGVMPHVTLVGVDSTNWIIVASSGFAPP